MRWTIVTIPLAIFASAASSQPPAPAAPTPPACTSEDHRALDFWVGRWDVSQTGTDRIVAQSLIERLYGGCAIRENWMPTKGTAGGSLSSYDPVARIWRQTWVDASGATVHFKGGIQSRNMVMIGWWRDVLGPGKGAMIRMTYSREPGGAVRQLGESSTDAGKSWKPNFDFTYRRSAGPESAG